MTSLICSFKIIVRMLACTTSTKKKKMKEKGKTYYSKIIVLVFRDHIGNSMILRFCRKSALIQEGILTEIWEQQ